MTRKCSDFYTAHVDWLPTNIKGLKGIPTFKDSTWNSLDALTGNLNFPYNWIISNISGNGQFSESNAKKTIEILKSKPQAELIVEIGTSCGSCVERGSTDIISKNKNADAYFYSIDIVAHNPGIDRQKYKNIEFVQSKSVDQKIKGILGNRLIDVLFIDGDHSLQVVFEEYQFYLPLMKKDGIILVHDTTLHPGPFLLMEAVNENTFKKEVFFEEDYGLGVIYLQ